jgi:hypothetical protein
MPIVRIDLIEGKSENIALKSGKLSTRPWWMFLTFHRGLRRENVVGE